MGCRLIGVGTCLWWSQDCISGTIATAAIGTDKMVRTC